MNVHTQAIYMQAGYIVKKKVHSPFCCNLQPDPKYQHLTYIMKIFTSLMYKTHRLVFK